MVRERTTRLTTRRPAGAAKAKEAKDHKRKVKEQPSLVMSEKIQRHLTSSPLIHLLQPPPVCTLVTSTSVVPSTQVAPVVRKRIYKCSKWAHFQFERSKSVFWKIWFFSDLWTVKRRDFTKKWKNNEILTEIAEKSKFSKKALHKNFLQTENGLQFCKK